MSWTIDLRIKQRNLFYKLKNYLKTATIRYNGYGDSFSDFYDIDWEVLDGVEINDTEIENDLYALAECILEFATTPNFNDDGSEGEFNINFELDSIEVDNYYVVRSRMSSGAELIDIEEPIHQIRRRLESCRSGDVLSLNFSFCFKGHKYTYPRGTEFYKVALKLNEIYDIDVERPAEEQTSEDIQPILNGGMTRPEYTITYDPQPYPEQDSSD